MSTASCTATSADVCWTRGDSGRLDVTVTQSDGTAYDLTGATLFLTVKNALTDADSAAVIRKEVTTHDAPEEGESYFEILTTDNATAGVRFYDVQLVTDLGDVFTLFGGIWKVVGDVTSRVTSEPNALIVSGAGTTTVNGLHTQRPDLNGRPTFQLQGQTTALGSGIWWGGDRWFIGADAFYVGDEDVAFPWLVTEWTVSNGDAPAPTVAPTTI
jgi:hypothetical protein